MVLILIGWGIATFVYFKVVIDWAFDADITVGAAIVLTLAESVFALIMTGLHAVQLLNYDWKIATTLAAFRSALSRNYVALIAVSLFDIVISRLVISGFSKDLDEEIQNFCRSGCVIHGTILKFVIIVFIPLFLQFAFSLLSVHRAAR